jgi:hypothetical protein
MDNVKALKPFAILALVMLAGCGVEPPPKVKSEQGYMKLNIFVDEETGCQYLYRSRYGITPRLNPDGTQVCEGD